jgi:hypothetical protein
MVIPTYANILGEKHSAIPVVIDDHKDTSKRKRTALAVGMLLPSKPPNECASAVHA